MTVAAVGRLRSRPEATLVYDYLERFGRTGRALGLGPARVAEIDDRKRDGIASEAALLSAAIPKGAWVVALDERGRGMNSPDFAETLERQAGTGVREAAFLIGGADGLDPSLRERADLLLSFGSMVWPHRLVRVMLAEQLYRAASILAGSPYHRE